MLSKVNRELNSENGRQTGYQKVPAFDIRSGNNHWVVRGILKKRAWWVRAEQAAEANFVWTCWRDPEVTAKLTANTVYNRLDCNYHLSNKKALFLNLTEYYTQLGLDAF